MEAQRIEKVQIVVCGGKAVQATPHQSPLATASPQGEAQHVEKICYNN
jgi:hypothetical protein